MILDISKLKPVLKNKIGFFMKKFIKIKKLLPKIDTLWYYYYVKWRKVVEYVSRKNSFNWKGYFRKRF